jgi:Protein of unknown function (DUF3617)
MHYLMRRAPVFLVAVLAVCCAFVPHASALDMPARKAGLWELHMDLGIANLPVRVMKHCIDAATDKLMNAQYGGAGQNCSRQDVAKSGATMTIDAVCEFGGATVTSHSVVSGSFDSAYTVDVTSTRAGGPPRPGMPPTGSTHMKIAAKWLGPCEAGQKPGDILMPNGMKMNILDMPKAPGAAPRKP